MRDMNDYEAEWPEEPIEECTGGFISIDGVCLGPVPVFDDPFGDEDEGA